MSTIGRTHNANGWTLESGPTGRAYRVDADTDTWVYKCRGCDEHWTTTGAPPMYVYERARHEAAHGLDVVGYNVAMLPN